MDDASPIDAATAVSPVENTSLVEDGWEPVVSEPQSPVLGSTSETIVLSPMDQQRVGLWVLTQKDRPIVSLDEMSKFLELPEDISLKTRIEELNDRFEEDLDRFYLGKSESYLDEAKALYYSCDETFLDDDLDKMYKEFGRRQTQDEWNYIFRHITRTYSSRLSDLTKGASFPQDMEEYRRLPREVQNCVTRFLLLDSDEKKQAMLKEFSWTWSQTTRLCDEFEKNPDFQKEIRSGAAAPIVDASNIADPRKRSSIG